MLNAVLLASGILLGLASAGTAHAGSPTPPPFERDEAGAARDGQRIAQPAGPRKQVVAIVPDRTTGRDWGLRYLKDAVRDINRAQPDAVFCVGDLVQGYSRDAAHVIREREDFLAITDRLGVPFYPTPGNHDLVSGRRDGRDRSFAEQYRRMFGPLYYAVELELASFVILNTEDGEGRIEPGFSDAQLAWLDETLATLAARNRPIILLFHRPLWDHKPTRWEERVQPMLSKHGVDYVIAGHYHALQALPPRDGIPHLLLGTCGGAIDQHPLTGQLQHLTFVVIDESGKIEPYHQVAGCTLPVDWMTKSDQDLAYRLKASKDAVRIRGSVDDPLGAATQGSVEVTLRNPLDREVEFAFERTGRAEAWEVLDREDGEDILRPWVSLTDKDTFNVSTTDIATRFEFEFEQARVKLAAGESRTVTVRARCAAQPAPSEPPPFEVVATYLDAKDRRVPVRLRQRLPLARRIVPAASADDAVPYSIAVWNWSEYDTPDRNATARFTAPAAGSDDAAFRISLKVLDSVFSGDAKPSDGKSAIDDPLGDGVRIVLGSGAESREYLVTFKPGTQEPLVRALSRDRSRLEPSEGALEVVLAAGQRSWHLTVTVRGAALPAGISAGTPLPINIGVADNDETYHTQWRWLAPRETPALLTTGGPAEPASAPSR